MTNRFQGSSVPLYHQIAQVLRRRIETGDYGKGGPLATESAICAEFGVSRTTVRHALSYLKSDGLLSSRRGVGTRSTVAPRKKKYIRSSNDPLHARLASKPRVISVEQAPAPQRVAEFFQIGAGDDVLKIVRVHVLDRQPLSVVISYLPARFGTQITRDALHGPVHEVLWRRYGLLQKKSVHAVRVARADIQVASLLRIGLSDPVLGIQSSVYLENGDPIRWTENFFREDLYEYTAEFLWSKPPP